MKTLKREECSVLSLVLKKRWYDMIARGEKREEYRASTAYWTNRIFAWWFRSVGCPHVVEFRCGYAANAPRLAFLCKEGFGHFDGARHPAWGEPAEIHFAIYLGERVELSGGKA